MADIVNLNQTRKKKERETASRQAAANRELSGRTSAEKQRLAAEEERTTRQLDGLEIEKPEE